MAIRDKILITLFGCAASFLAAAGEATYDAKDLPSKDRYFWFASLHRVCHKDAPPSTKLLAFKKQVLDYYKVQLAAASGTKQADYRESIRQVDNNEIAQAELTTMQAKIKKMGSSSSALMCKNLEAVTNGQIAIGNIAIAQQRDDPKAVEVAVKASLAQGQTNSQIIQDQLPEIAAAMSERPVAGVEQKKARVANELPPDLPK